MIDSNASATRQTLADLIEKQHLNEQHIPHAIALAELSQSTERWQDFIRTILFWSGSIAMAFSLIFFIAANWQDIGRIAKFVLVEVAIVTAMFTYIKYKHHDSIRHASLVLCMLLVGGLMALFGQTYQTGADPWQLFFNWAILTTPWVLISRFSVIWLIWLGLLNLSLSLYYQTFGGFFDHTMALFLLNSLALAAWQSGALKFGWLNKQWAINLLGAVSGYFAMWVYMEALFDDKPFGALVWCAWTGLIFYIYRFRLLNVFMLAGWSLSILVATDALIIKIIGDSFNAFAFLVLASTTLGGGTFLTIWLKGLIRDIRS